jgi:hypothetical protein
MSPFAGMRFVACCRVSPDKRGRSSLDFDAKPEVVARHVAGQGGAGATAFDKVENGRRGDLPSSPSPWPDAVPSGAWWSLPSSTA